ncbi:MAG TPA: VPLPA-CTERM sorting domain-containing protein [Methylococcaceae bacterium]|nr:VPLPA-CTERM sorting domain-containing protein [Methylococcaceae bacterium]
MNALKNCRHLMPVLLALAPAVLWIPSAQAAAAFAGSAALTFTVNRIVNLDNPGDLTALTVTGSFEQASPPDYSVTLTGDGSVSDDNPVAGPVSVGSGVFNHTFAVSGSVGNGSVNSSHLGLFGLSFENTGSDGYAIGVTLDYLLDAAILGQYAAGAVDLDFYNEGFSFIGFDHASANDQHTGSSGEFSFVLNPGEFEALYADVRITGNLEASAVPLPAGLWLLLAGLSAVAVVGRRNGSRPETHPVPNA